MFRLTILVCALSLVVARPISFEFIGSGFKHVSGKPDLTFSTGGSRFDLPGISSCGEMVGQPCDPVSPQAVTPLAPQGCDQGSDQSCGSSPQQTPPQQAPPAEIPPQQASPIPQDCDQGNGQYCGSSPQQTPPQQASPTPQGCDQGNSQSCSGPTYFNFSNGQSKEIKASSYKETTLYYNHKDAQCMSKSASSSTQLNYQKN
ncbi:hypothetical protein IWW38_001748 [Coemansia aciculifera]|uniref:Uncharacterized protein n=1 Tax=Coemansia aciculifera TaxID=417176 RepID=A0ACC1M6B5_9FUNG|nr:hypothetical protein IWW38_001748 [Coemansia aciculifera]